MVDGGPRQGEQRRGRLGLRQPARHRQRHPRHDDRDVGVARHDLRGARAPARTRTSSSVSRPCPARVATVACVVDGAALWIVNKSAPEKQAAAWEFAKFLNTAESQADVGGRHRLRADREGGGGLARGPGRSGRGSRATRSPTTSCSPAPSNLATAGPVIGDYTGVQTRCASRGRACSRRARARSRRSSRPPTDSDSAMQEYNSRVGA